MQRRRQCPQYLHLRYGVGDNWKHDSARDAGLADTDQRRHRRVDDGVADVERHGCDVV